MEIKKSYKNDQFQNKFLLLLFIALLIIISFIGILYSMSSKENILFYKWLAMIIMVLLLLITLVLITTILSVVMINYNKDIPVLIKKTMKWGVMIFYPLLLFLGRVFHYDKDSIRRAYTNLNNKLILSNKYFIKGEDVLVLTPHCIQKASCPHKITNDTNNCRKCGLCDIGYLLNMKEKYGIQFKVVTGGTLARKVIGELKPKAIIAIACERDLISGLQEVRHIPVMTVVNKRPEGPCVNTLVDLKEVERAINHFIKE